MNYCSEYTLPEKYKVKVDTIGKRGITHLFKYHKWPTTLWKYLLIHHTIISGISLMEESITDSAHRFNILAELYSFLTQISNHQNIHTVCTGIESSAQCNATGVTHNSRFPFSLDGFAIQQKENKKGVSLEFSVSGIAPEVVSKLANIITHQEQGKRITSAQRYFIRKHFEIDPRGIECIAQFETYIRDKNILTEQGMLLLNPYTSILNLNEIYIQARYKYTIAYSYNKHKYNNITIYTPTKMSMTSRKDVMYIEQLVTYVCLYPYLLGQEKLINQPQNISLYLVHFPKRFMHAKGRDPLVYTSSEINTGVCDMVNIAVTRSEEALKTVLHELFHYYNMDFKHAHIPHEKKLSAQYNINNKLDSLNLFEAYTECMASIINIICWSYFNNSSSSTENVLNKDIICNMFSEQIIYTMYKLAKILKLNKCNSFMDSTCQLNQTTNVASYFLFKLFLYCDLVTLAKTCIDDSIPKFIESRASTACLIDIISQGSQNKTVGNIINYLLESTNNIPTITSARMTCIDTMK